MSLFLHSFQVSASFLYVLYRKMVLDLFLETSTRMAFTPDIAPIYMSFNFMYITFSIRLKYFDHSGIQME